MLRTIPFVKELEVPMSLSSQRLYPFAIGQDPRYTSRFSIGSYVLSLYSKVIYFPSHYIFLISANGVIATFLG